MVVIGIIVHWQLLNLTANINDYQRREQSIRSYSLFMRIGLQKIEFLLNFSKISLNDCLTYDPSRRNVIDR